MKVFKDAVGLLAIPETKTVSPITQTPFAVARRGQT